MIRPTRAADLLALLELAAATHVFKPIELTALKEVLEDYLAKPFGDGYHCYTFERDGRAVGFTCHGPNTMTDRTWDLYWIAVAPALHGQGIGAELLRFSEDDIRQHNGRIIIIETSSMDSYIPTRGFYLKHGYEQAAVINDFYADGDSLVLFRKRL